MRSTVLALALIMAAIHPLRTRAAQAVPPLDDLFAAFAQPNVPGVSVLVARNGQVVFEKAYGLADVEHQVPAQLNTDYRLASLSKQFTAMAIMILADRGKLNLDAPITNFFPEFPAYGAKITVKQLLHHTSGLIDYEDVIPTGTTLPVVDLNVLCLLLKETNTYFAPGSQFRYSNSGYSLLALIVEKVSGQTFSGFLQNNIFRPLRMDATLAYESGLNAVPHRAFGHSETNGAFVKTDQSLTSSVLGDGGIYSNVEDMLKWDRSLSTAKLVSKKTRDYIFTPGPNTTDDKGTHYGCGWFIGDYRGLKEIWHYGDTMGFNTQIARYPEKKLTIIILANRNPAHLGDLPHRIADRFLFAANSKPTSP